jgi:hypothetical protein
LTVKEKIKYLISEYNDGNYTTNDFCDLYTNIFNFEIVKDDYTEEMYTKLQKLMQITSRYSPFEEDQKLDPNAFTKDIDVKKALEGIDAIQI